MSPIVTRLAELRRHLDHLRAIRSRVSSETVLAEDLSLRNDVLYSLLMICQVVIDVASELSARRGQPFGDYTEAVRNLATDSRFPSALVSELEGLPAFRNALVHGYATLDLGRVMAALDRLEPVERFLQIAADIAAKEL